jgi:hypothetical protein
MKMRGVLDTINYLNMWLSAHQDAPTAPHGSIGIRSPAHGSG